jgi:DNA-binding transcriptional regulator YiaG
MIEKRFSNMLATRACFSSDHMLPTINESVFRKANVRVLDNEENKHMPSCIKIHTKTTKLSRPATAATLNISKKNLVGLPSGSLRNTLTISDSSRDSSSGSSATNFDTACTWGQSMHKKKKQ